MFSSNPFNQIPSSSFFEHEKDGVHFFHHHNDINRFVPEDCIFDAHNNLAPSPVMAENGILVRQQDQLGKESGFHFCDDLLESVIYSSKRKIANMKKDGHSKIHTAQGPRDRRVRLSIEVARKFFSLQDLLGFDKASKTLDWLFTKSKTAIKELVEEMKHCSSSCATDHCEVVFQETINRGSDEEDKLGQKKRSATKYADGKRKKMSRKFKSGRVDVNQSRAEARARARERTREKLQNKKLDDESKKVPENCYRPGSPSNLTLQSSFWTEMESQNELNHRSGESTMDPKFAMGSSMFFAYQENLVESNDLSSQIKYTSFLN